MGILASGSQRIRNLKVKAYTLSVRHRFRQLNSHLDPRVDITNPQFISIGRGVVIRPYTWIYAITNDRGHRGVFNPSIQIGDGCSIGRFCHLTCSNQVVLEDHVFITEGVLITDSIHGYEDITTPIIEQPLMSLGPIIIGCGSWIGNGARIIGKVRIGRNCIIGANAFVNKDVPDYCMVAGVPGRIVKQYDPTARQWRVMKEPLKLGANPIGV
jgi:acetyltransferase-like isoleucine patch superfamily enzyme